MSKSWSYHNSYIHPCSGGTVTSAVIRVMLSHFGLRKTMLIKAGVDTVVLGTAYLLISERHKPSAKIIWFDRRFLTDPTFWSITLCLCLANVGYPAPFYYLPVFAKQKIPNLSELVSVKCCSPGRLTICHSFLSSLSLSSAYRLRSAVVVSDSSLIGLGRQMPCLSSS